MPVIRGIRAAVVAVALIASTAGTDETTPDDTAPIAVEMWPATGLGQAMVSCFDPEVEFVYIPDEDTLVIDGAYQNDDFVAGAASGLVLACVLADLDLPERVVSHIDQTRALDGIQEDSWGDYNARWSYHPDSGLSITIWREELPTEEMMVLPAPTTTTTTTVPTTTTTPTTTAAVPANAVVPRDSAASCQAPDSEEADGTPIVFAPGNVLDQDPATVWRCEASAVDRSLSFTFDDPTPLTSVGLIGGYVKVDPLTGVDRFPQNHRVRQVRWTFDDGTTVTQDLADSRQMQTIPVDVTTSTVRLEVLATYPPGDELPRDFVAVAEVQLLGSSVPSESFTGPWADGATIPANYTCDGANDVPLVSWTPPPDSTAELTLSVVDQDAAGFVHWLVVDLPAQAGSIGGDEPIVVGAEVLNSFGNSGWGGPCPPPGDGPHTYLFTLHLLDQPIELRADAPTDELLAAVEAATADRLTFTGSYERT